MSIRVAQINTAELAAFVTAQSSGSVGPSLQAYLAASGNYLGPLVIYTTGDVTVGGTKTFTNAPVVPYSGSPTTAPSRQYLLDTLSGSLAVATLATTGASVNLAGNQTVLDAKTFTGEVGVGTATSVGSAATLGQLSGASGVLAALVGGTVSEATLAATGAKITALSGHVGLVSGAIQTLLTAQQTQINLLPPSGLTTGLSGVMNTRTVVGYSFFMNAVVTGLNLEETFAARTFTFTGAAFACRASGATGLNGGIMTGRLYQVDFNNTEHTLYSFTFNTGLIHSGSPVFSTTVTGGNRVGISLTNSLSGIEKFTVGLFGV